ncbi:transposase [Frankia gtarii]|uniref:transposase n=1 Tax=Frankia gtarii TaxID=2950102 RepID=UPI0021BFD2B6|nr:transposase [Frankia gtarii]
MRYQSTVGLSADEIAEIVGRIEEVLTSHPTGRPPLMSLTEQVEMVLLLLRRNLPQTVIADLYQVSQPTVSRVYRRLMPLFDKVLCLHEPAFVDVLANRETLIDGTDVPTGNRAGKKENYSGKRHRQGLNIQVAADLDGTLLAVSDPVPGARHDRKAISECGWEPLLDTTVWTADPGYQGTTATTPTKKPKNDELTDYQKTVNKTISGRRSAVERAIAHLKNWKILATGYRGLLAELPNIIRIVARLEFYRLGW